MPISHKQKQILAFPYTTKYQALICDGAVRSGKTSIMTIAFIDWAMREFDNTNFAICGKTVTSAIKNIVRPFLGLTWSKDKYKMKFVRSPDNMLTIKWGHKTNIFYVYGGRDESSFELIQGLTAAGILFDEVALQPRTFVEEAIARCLTFSKRRYFFNCNPASPMHWFYTEWVIQPEKHKALRLRFKMQDNPALSEEDILQTSQDFSGVFYQRKVLGEWVIAEGLVYPNFDADRHIKEYEIPKSLTHYREDNQGLWWISLDYGIVNPFSAHLWNVVDGVAQCENEYYHDPKEDGKGQRTDEEHYSALERLAGDRLIQYIVVDPSASSFKETIRRHGRYNVRNADNEVLAGIANCMTLLDTEYIKFSAKCINLKREFGLYSWDADSGKDEVIKQNDHAMDDFRYFVNTVLKRELKHIDWSKE